MVGDDGVWVREELREQERQAKPARKQQNLLGTNFWPFTNFHMPVSAVPIKSTPNFIYGSDSDLFRLFTTATTINPLIPSLFLSLSLFLWGKHMGWWGSTTETEAILWVTQAVHAVTNIHAAALLADRCAYVLGWERMRWAKYCLKWNFFRLQYKQTRGHACVLFAGIDMVTKWQLEES